MQHHSLEHLYQCGTTVVSEGYVTVLDKDPEEEVDHHSRLKLKEVLNTRAREQYAAIGVVMTSQNGTKVNSHMYTTHHLYNPVDAPHLSPLKVPEQSIIHSLYELISKKS